MSDSVTRLTSGNTVVVRTGALAGIGPVGPIGPSGPRGYEGEQGPQGLPGPTGSIEDGFSKATSYLGTPFTVTPNNDTLASWPTTVTDTFGIVYSTTAFKLPVGVWFYVFTVTFAKPTGTANGVRQATAYYDNSAASSVSTPASTVTDTSFQLVGIVDARGLPDRNLTVKLRSTDSSSISCQAQMEITKVGPGVTGPTGLMGPYGPQGPVGPMGPAGPSGSMMDPDTTYQSMGGT